MAIGTRRAERDPLPGLREDLLREYAGMFSADEIESVAQQALHEYDDVPIREFVPVLAWRRARLRLRGSL